jgi:G:T-mismatch repair DNA endonuclease (very short patch repair protein)
MSDSEWYDFILGDKQRDILTDYTVNEINFQPLCLKYNTSTEWLALFLFDYHKLKKRSIAETRKTKGYTDQYKDTCISNYGVDNPSKNNQIKEKKKETLFKNFGYINNFCNPCIQAKAQAKINYQDVANTIKLVCVEKYGVSNPTQTDNVKKKLREAWSKRKSEWSEGNFIDSQSIIYKSSKFVSRPEMKLHHCIKHIVGEKDLKFNSWVGGVNVDILIQSKNIAIDFNGDFWHANPRKYCDEDVMFHDKHGGQVTAKQIHKKDKKRVDKLNELGYNVFVVWESDIKDKSDVEVTQILNDIIENDENSKNYKY